MEFIIRAHRFGTNEIPNVFNHTIADELYPIRILAADCSFLQYLGFNHVPSRCFFLLSSHSRLCIFHHYVVAQRALESSFQQFNGEYFTRTSPYAGAGISSTPGFSSTVILLLSDVIILLIQSSCNLDRG